MFLLETTIPQATLRLHSMTGTETELYNFYNRKILERL